jgi:LuxR family maltose regulon positive regulatory protein
MQGNTARALGCLERALRLAEPEGYIRTFVDEGEPMRSLIEELRLAIARRRPGDPRLLAYMDRLLSAFAGESLESALDAPSDQQPTTSNLVEALSERELEVLRLIQAGFSNEEIAEQLVIAVSTVKTHVNNLYGKFGVHSRTQAIAAARELGFFSD